MLILCLSASKFGNITTLWTFSCHIFTALAQKRHFCQNSDTFIEFSDPDFL